MCLLIVLRGLDPDYPILVASNRDEARDRKASPPGLWVGQRRRVLSPRDRRAQGTWLGVNDLGMFAGLTNAPGRAHEGAETRGRLPHLALDHDDAQAGAGAVLVEVEQAPCNPFQLLVADHKRIVRVAHDGERCVLEPLAGPAIVVSNEHPPGVLQLDLAAACAPGLTASQRLDELAALLLHEGGEGRHAILKKGAAYGTVSSALLAVPAGDPRALLLRFAPGPPDEVAYRNYGNLARRLVQG